MQYFPTTSPVGATVFAALLMWREASPEARAEYAVHSTGARQFKPLSNMGIDTVCESLRFHGGGIALRDDPQLHHCKPLAGEDSAGGLPTTSHPWTFAGARDGDLTYGLCEAEGEEEARAEALAHCWAHHGLEGEPDECELDGFAVWKPLAPPLPAAAELLRIAAELEDGASADIWYDAADHGDEGGYNAIEDAQKAMNDAAAILRRLDAMPAEKETASAELLARARATLQTNELEIDDNAAISRSDDGGHWVSSWAWLPFKLYTVTLEASGIEVTADSLPEARKYAAEDAGQFQAQWNYSAAEITEGGDVDDLAEEPRPSLELESHSGKTFTFAASWEITVDAETEEEAKAAALAVLKGAQA